MTEVKLELRDITMDEHVGDMLVVMELPEHYLAQAVVMRAILDYQSTKCPVEQKKAREWFESDDTSEKSFIWWSLLISPQPEAFRETIRKFLRTGIKVAHPKVSQSQ